MAQEIKSISVPPSAEEAVINNWQCWGWKLKSTQEVKTQDVQTYTGQGTDGTKYYETTKGEHYIKLTFERDSSMPNYAELCQLEQKYQKYGDYQIPEKPGEPMMPIKSKPGCWTWGFSIFFVLMGILVVATGVFGENIGENIVGGIVGGAMFIIVGVAIFKISPLLSNIGHKKRCLAYPKEHAEWEKEYSDWEKRRDEYNQAKKMMPEIIERARSLLG